MEERKLKFFDEVSTLSASYTDAVIKLADKYGEDRKNTLEMVGVGFSTIAELGNFDNYQPTPEPPKDPIDFCGVVCKYAEELIEKPKPKQSKTLLNG